MKGHFLTAGLRKLNRHYQSEPVQDKKPWVSSIGADMKRWVYTGVTTDPDESDRTPLNGVVVSVGRFQRPTVHDTINLQVKVYPDTIYKSIHLAFYFRGKYEYCFYIRSDLDPNGYNDYYHNTIFDSTASYCFWKLVEGTTSTYIEVLHNAFTVTKYTSTGEIIKDGKTEVQYHGELFYYVITTDKNIKCRPTGVDIYSYAETDRRISIGYKKLAVQTALANYGTFNVNTNGELSGGVLWLH